MGKDKKSQEGSPFKIQGQGGAAKCFLHNSSIGGNLMKYLQLLKLLVFWFKLWGKAD